MGESVRCRHPSQRGLVLLTAWVEPALRERVRTRAKALDVPVSAWIEASLDMACAHDEERDQEQERKVRP